MAAWTKSRFISAIAVILLSAVGASTTRAITPDNPGGGSIQFTIDSGLSVKEISPWICGTNFDTVPTATLNRIGGNRLTGYNWENNASNAGSDWYHHSDFGMASGPNDPPGTAFRGAIQSAAPDGQAVLVTIPMAGYQSIWEMSVKLHQDYRKLLEQEKPDVVTIGTPDHWHVPIANRPQRREPECGDGVPVPQDLPAQPPSARSLTGISNPSGYHLPPFHSDYDQGGCGKSNFLSLIT